MIEFQHGTDRLRFRLKKRNNEEAKKIEMEMEAQRVEIGLVSHFRRSMIDKVYRFSERNRIIDLDSRRRKSD